MVWGKVEYAFGMDELSFSQMNSNRLNRKQKIGVLRYEQFELYLCVYFFILMEPEKAPRVRYIISFYLSWSIAIV